MRIASSRPSNALVFELARFRKMMSSLRREAYENGNSPARFPSLCRLRTSARCRNTIALPPFPSTTTSSPRLLSWRLSNSEVSCKAKRRS